MKHKVTSLITKLRTDPKETTKSKRNYQKAQEQLPPLPLPIGEMYHKFLSIG
jgi:hypothetical protein